MCSHIEALKKSLDLVWGKKCLLRLTLSLKEDWILRMKRYVQCHTYIAVAECAMSGPDSGPVLSSCFYKYTVSINTYIQYELL